MSVAGGQQYQTHCSLPRNPTSLGKKGEKGVPQFEVSHRPHTDAFQLPQDMRRLWPRARLQLMRGLKREVLLAGTAWLHAAFAAWVSAAFSQLPSNPSFHAMKAVVLGSSLPLYLWPLSLLPPRAASVGSLEEKLQFTSLLL